MAFVGSLSGSGGASNTINVTGSMIIANPGTGGLFPAFPGTDTVFFVSGAIDGKTAGSRTVSVFGGDVVASGSITVGTGSVKITSNDIQFNSFDTRIASGSGGLTFFDSGNSGGVTLTSLTAGAGGGDVDGPASATDNAIARFDQTTGKIIQNSAVTISDESANVVSIAGSATATTINLFNTDATTVNIAGGATTATSIGNASGLTTIAGDLKVAGNDIQSSTGATAITLSGGNVIIPGDLTVQGTTVTVDATTLTIEDPVIGLGFTSGSTATTAGDRGFIGGMDTGGNVALFWDNTDSTFTSVRTSTGAGHDPVDITSYTPFRASSFQVGGTPGSAVAAGSAYLSSSDALNVLVNHTATTTFTKAGSAIVQISDNGGEGMITGNSAINTISSLWVSGTSVNMAHTLSASAGGPPNAIKIIGGGLEGGSLRISGSPGSTVFNINAHDGGNIPKSLVVSGSAIAINAATSNSTNGVTIQGAGTSLARFWGSSTNTEIDLLGTSNNVIDGTGNASAELSLSGSNVNLRHGAAGGAAITLQRVNTKYGEIQNAADGSRSYTQFNSVLNSSAASNVRIGTAVNGANSGFINLSGSLVEVLAENGAQFQTRGTSTAFLTVQSGSYVTPPGTALNFAKIEAGLANNLLVGSQGVTAVSGSSGIRMNVGGGNTVAMQSHGTAFLTFASGSGVDNSVTIAPVNATTANLLNTVATTVNFAGAATTLTMGDATTATTTVRGGTLVGNTSTQAVFNTTATTVNAFGAATAINVGAANGTLTSNVNIVPSSTNSYDLGTPSLRWRNMYTGDLHLKNERGDWTVIEEEDFLTLTNNKSGKRYKFVLEEI
jgi:hypothetical protein